MVVHMRPRLTPLAALLIAVAGSARAQEQLCLKDSGCQPIKGYEVQGDRVRYYSLDRSAWEEVPLAVVDFEAMKKAQAEAEAAHQAEREAARKLDRQIFDKVENKGFEIAPGVRLPGDGGVFAYDGLRVIRLLQSEAEIVKDKKRAALTIAIMAVHLGGIRSPYMHGISIVALVRATLVPTHWRRALKTYGRIGECPGIRLQTSSHPRRGSAPHVDPCDPLRSRVQQTDPLGFRRTRH